MIGIINKSEPDADWSWQSQYVMPTYATREVKREVIVSKMSDLPPCSPQLKQEIADTLVYHSSIRLIPLG